MQHLITIHYTLYLLIQLVCICVEMQFRQNGYIEIVQPFHELKCQIVSESPV